MEIYQDKFEIKRKWWWGDKNKPIAIYNPEFWHLVVYLKHGSSLKLPEDIVVLFNE